MAVGPVGAAHLPSDRPVVLLPETRALRRRVDRGTSPAAIAHAGTRPRRARTALSAGVLEGHRDGFVRAAVRRADGAPRGADSVAPVREGGWRIQDCSRQAAGRVEAAGVTRTVGRLDGERRELCVRLRSLAAQSLPAPAGPPPP